MQAQGNDAMHFLPVPLFLYFLLPPLSFLFLFSLCLAVYTRTVGEDVQLGCNLYVEQMQKKAKKKMVLREVGSLTFQKMNDRLMSMNGFGLYSIIRTICRLSVTTFS